MKSIRESDEHTYVNFYFQVHQPSRIKHLGFFDIGKDHAYFDEGLNEKIIRQVAKNCYQPANLMLLDLIKKFPQTRITFSISGVALEQLKKYSPEVIESFKKLAATGSVEFLGETYFHTLAGLYDADEFIYQVNLHRQVMKKVLGVTPAVFRNTELIYSDAIGRKVRMMGFNGVYADGIGKILGQRSPDHLYEHADGNGLKVFLRNYSLSDDIAFRFSNCSWKEWPLTPEKYTRWLTARSSGDRLINLALDYETFGEHQKAETGIFKFMKQVISTIAKSKKLQMVTPSEAIRILTPKDRISAPVPISWADKARDLSAWLGNDLQRDAFDTMRALKKEITESGDDVLLDSIRYLQTSDHFYYMSTKKGDDGNIHNYFSPYASPYEAFINYMNVLSDIAFKLKNKKKLSASIMPAALIKFPEGEPVAV